MPPAPVDVHKDLLDVTCIHPHVCTKYRTYLHPPIFDLLTQTKDPGEKKADGNMNGRKVGPIDCCRRPSRWKFCMNGSSVIGVVFHV